MTLQELAYSILDKTESSDIAVFHWRGDIKTSNAGSDFAEKLIADQKRWKLMGIYDDSCKLEWMMEDLKYVGAKYDH